MQFSEYAESCILICQKNRFLLYNEFINVDLDLLKAYYNTTYQSYDPTFSIRIGQLNEKLNRYLSSNQYYEWAFITAENPLSKKLSKIENANRSRQLKLLLLSKNLKFTNGYGIPDNSDWEAEKSFLIFGISLQLSTEINIHFNQNAFVFGEKDSKSQLILTH